MATIRVGDINLGYKERGAGDAIIFLHGVGTDKSAWDEQLEFFSRQKRAIALDYPGYGESDLPSRSLSRAEIARYILAAMRELGVESAHIVGLSMGGTTALEILQQQPSRVRSVVIADGFAKHPDGDKIVERARQALMTKSMREIAEARVNLLFTPNASMMLREEVVAMMSKIDKRTYAWASEAVWTADYRACLPRIDAPTLIMVGEHDCITPFELSAELYGGIAGAEMEIVPCAGHLSNMENPFAFNKAIESFLLAVEEHKEALSLIW